MEITQEYLKKIYNYNKDSGEFTYKISKGSKKKGDIAGSYWNGYTCIKIDSVKYQAHRIAWVYVYGVFPNGEIDHINHNRRDNRILNLREVTTKENQRNATLRKDNSSGIIGVSFNKKINKWTAYISDDNKKYFLGNYKNKEDAINARQYANVLFGYHENHGMARPVSP